MINSVMKQGSLSPMYPPSILLVETPDRSNKARFFFPTAVFVGASGVDEQRNPGYLPAAHEQSFAPQGNNGADALADNFSSCN